MAHQISQVQFYDNESPRTNPQANSGLTPFILNEASELRVEDQSNQIPSRSQKNASSSPSFEEDYWLNHFKKMVMLKYLSHYTFSNWQNAFKTSGTLLYDLIQSLYHTIGGRKKTDCGCALTPKTAFNEKFKNK